MAACSTARGSMTYPQLPQMDWSHPHLWSARNYSLKKHGSDVFDLELDPSGSGSLTASGRVGLLAEGGASPAGLQASAEKAGVAHVVREVQRLARPGEEAEEVLSVLRELQHSSHALTADSDRLAAALAQRGLAASRSSTSSSRQVHRPAKTSQALRKPPTRHSYVVVEQPCAAPLVVDAAFRDQWAVPQATPAYSVVVAALPDCFIGTVHDLAKLVRILAAELKSAFHSQQLALPPWRTCDAMLSKWLEADDRVKAAAAARNEHSHPHTRAAGAAPHGAGVVPMQLTFRPNNARVQRHNTPVEGAPTQHSDAPVKGALLAQLETERPARSQRKPSHTPFAAVKAPW